MPEKCRRAKGATLQLCDSAANALSAEMIRLQSLVDRETQKRRQRLAIVVSKKCAPLYYCPWCRADIDTTPREPAPKEAP